MIIGIPKEIKNNEYRVGLIPGGVYGLSSDGHQVVVASTAGAGIQCSDDDYIKAGATILESNESVYAKADMIVKVKEPVVCEL